MTIKYTKTEKICERFVIIGVNAQKVLENYIEKQI